MAGKVELEVIQRRSASQMVAERILDQIRKGALKSGDQLPTEKDLMRQLGVGRSSVREGLQIIATLNLIETRHGIGAFLRLPKLSDRLNPELLGPLLSNVPAFEFLEARQMIEPNAIYLACLRATKTELDAIDALLDEHARLLDNGEPANEPAARFHVMLAECSHNQIATQFMSSIMSMLMARGRKIDRIPMYAQQEVDEHRALLALVRAGEPEPAAIAMAGHIVASAQTYDVELGPEADGLADLRDFATSGFLHHFSGSLDK